MYRNKYSKVYQLPMDVPLGWRKHGRMLTLASGCRRELSHAACLRTIHPVFSCPACRGCLLAFWRCGLERFPCVLCPRRRNPSGRGPRKGICLPKKDGMPARGGASGVPARGPHAAASAPALRDGTGLPEGQTLMRGKERRRTERSGASPMASLEPAISRAVPGILPSCSSCTAG